MVDLNSPLARHLMHGLRTRAAIQRAFPGAWALAYGKGEVPTLVVLGPEDTVVPETHNFVIDGAEHVVPCRHVPTKPIDEAGKAALMRDEEGESAQAKAA